MLSASSDSGSRLYADSGQWFPSSPCPACLVDVALGQVVHQPHLAPLLDCKTLADYSSLWQALFSERSFRAAFRYFIETFQPQFFQKLR